MAETRARFLANTIGATSASNDFTLPDGVGTNKQVLETDGAGGTTWVTALTAPTISSVTGTLNEYEDGVSEDGGVLTINGSDFGADPSALSVQISGTTGFAVIAETTTISITSAGTQFTATFTGAETNYNHSSFAAGTNIYVKVTKSGLQTSTYATLGTAMTGDPSFQTTSTTASTHTGTLAATSLGSYGGQIAGGGDDSNTKLLLNFDRTGGTDIEDSSNIGGEGNKITANGNAVIKASPFGDGKTAMFFDGNDDYLSIPTSSDFQFGSTNSFTVEFWIRPEGTIGTAEGICSLNNSGSTDSDFYCRLESGKINWYNNADHASPSTSDFVSGIWYHVAFVRKSGTMYCYKDGKLLYSFSDSYNYDGNGEWGIGARKTGGSWTQFGEMYLDEFRVVKGTNATDGAVYSSDFDVPTSRLTAIDNTKLLIHSDQSYNNADNKIPITLNGLTMTTTDTRTAWGGSAWDFDGVNDYAYTAPSTDFDLLGQNGTTNPYDWTLECWIRVQNLGDWDRIVSLADSNTWGGWALHLDGASSTYHMLFGDDNQAVNISGGSASIPTPGTWHHYAVVHDSSADTLTMYKDGVQVGQTINASSTNWNYNATNRPVLIGARSSSGTSAVGGYSGAPTNFFDGMIEDLRIVVGTKVYTGAFNNSLPSGPLTTTGGSYNVGSDIANVNRSFSASHTKLLVHGDGGKFTDSSDGASNQSTAHNITPTGSFHSEGHGGIAPAMDFPASLKKTGSAGVYFDGNGDHLTIPASTDWYFGSGDATVELWVYPTSTTGGDKRIISSQGGGNLWIIFWDKTANKFSVQSTNFSVTASTNTFSLNQWYHLALTKVGTAIKLYVNGVLEISGTATGDFPDTQGTLEIGAYSNGTEAFYGYVDGVRISKGVARYSSAFNTDLPTEVYGAYRSQDVGTIQLNASAGTGGGTLDYAELSGGTALSTYGLSLSSSGAITGTLTGLADNSNSGGVIRIRARANADDNRVTTLGGSSFTGITQNDDKAPVLFNARRYAGTSANRDINGLGFQPDLVWIKTRNDAFSHKLFDSVRGPGNWLLSDTNDAENATGSRYGHLGNFLADGFSIREGVSGWHETNLTGKTYISWAFKAGGAPTVDNSGGQTPTSGSKMVNGSVSSTAYTSADIYPKRQSVNSAGDFSITQYAGTFDQQNQIKTIPHGLSGTPDWVVIKNTGDSYGWTVFHTNLTANKYLRLNTSDAEGDSDWGYITTNTNGNLLDLHSSTASGSSTHYGKRVGRSGHNYIMYAWKAVAGVSAFGTYEGTAGAHSVNIGFKPRFVMVKNIDVSGRYWAIQDAFRTSGDTSTTHLYADLANADDTATIKTMIFQNTGFGFTTDSTYHSINESGQTFIYIAFK